MQRPRRRLAMLQPSRVLRTKARYLRQGHQPSSWRHYPYSPPIFCFSASIVHPRYFVTSHAQSDHWKDPTCWGRRSLRLVGFVDLLCDGLDRGGRVSAGNSLGQGGGELLRFLPATVIVLPISFRLRAPGCLACQPGLFSNASSSPTEESVSYRPKVSSPPAKSIAAPATAKRSQQPTPMPGKPPLPSDKL